MHLYNFTNISLDKIFPLIKFLCLVEWILLCQHLKMYFGKFEFTTWLKVLRVQKSSEPVSHIHLSRSRLEHIHVNII